MTDTTPRTTNSSSDLFIDIETFSSVSIDNGVYAYTNAEDFDILLFAYAFGDEEVKVIDLKHGEEIPGELLYILSDAYFTKHAFNANFERVCLSRWLGLEDEFLPPEQWHCTMIECAYNGLPMSLKGAGEALDITDKKMDEGKALIKKFCTPGNKQTLFDGEEWELFKKYNKRDVEAEREIHNKLPFKVQYPVWQEYALDQRINDWGVKIDYKLVNNAIRINETITQEYFSELKELTGLANPKSVQQLKAWLADQEVNADSLDKAAVAELMTSVPENVQGVLRLKLLLSKSSIKKYETMLDLQGEGDRARGCFQFYGSHTGRWAGRHIQLQNLPQNHISNIEDVRELVREGDTETLEALYDNIPQILSELIRTTIVPRPGCKLFVADFSAIEARVIAWLAEETWRTEVFKNGGDIYCASASAMFKVPVKKNGINGHLRQKGKIAELALGYGGSVGALKAFGAVKMGIPKNELKDIVSSWRAANQNICGLWYAVDNAAKKAIDTGLHSKVGNGSVLIGRKNDDLVIKLPSGRLLIYKSAQICSNKFGGESISYMGVNAARKWARIETRGARLVENIVQAIARDLLAAAMQRVESRREGLKIIAHVHDEMIIEGADQGSDAENTKALNDIICVMCEKPDWAEGMILNAAGFVSDFYMKD